MKFYIPPQLLRLAIAFGIFISLFLLLRSCLVPDTFGQYGHYRGDSLKDNVLPEIHHSGQKACFECHQDIEDLKQKGSHTTIHCETCHGPGQKHVSSMEASDILTADSREFCGICHEKNAARRQSTIVQIHLSEHNVGKKCIECHNPHQPWEMKE